MSGIYIGVEDQFRGRRAMLIQFKTYIQAQFNEGKLWETHSWLLFQPSDWEIDVDNSTE